MARKSKARSTGSKANRRKGRTKPARGAAKRKSKKMAITNPGTPVGPTRAALARKARKKPKAKKPAKKPTTKRPARRTKMKTRGGAKVQLPGAPLSGPGGQRAITNPGTQRGPTRAAPPLAITNPGTPVGPTRTSSPLAITNPLTPVGPTRTSSPLAITNPGTQVGPTRTFVSNKTDADTD